MTVVRIGLDIAKTVFQIHGVDQHGKTVLKKTLARGEVLGFFANTLVSRIGIEACAGSHDWARELLKLGHDARLMVAQFVSPTARVTRTTPTMPRRSAKPWVDPTCALSLSSRRTHRPCWPCIGLVA